MHAATGLPNPPLPLGLCGVAPLGLEVGRLVACVDALGRARRRGGFKKPVQPKGPIKTEAACALDTLKPEAASKDDELARLLLDVQAGVQASFDRLYALTKPRLLRAILRIERDAVEAEDLLQEVYLRIWRLSSQFDANKGNVDMWLTGIARNMALDRVRRRNARPKALVRSDDADPYELVASTDAGPLETAMQAQSAAALQRCLATLRPSHREVLQLAFWSALSYAEIAEASGRPLGTVKSWANRALSELRKGLSGPAQRCGALRAQAAIG